MTTADEAADILDDSADRLDKNDWVQGFLKALIHRRIKGAPVNVVRTDVGYCVVGSMIYTLDENWDDYVEDLIDENPLLARAMIILHKTIFPQRSLSRREGAMCCLAEIERWNDQDGRTKQEVLDALRKAAKVARCT